MSVGFHDTMAALTQQQTAEQTLTAQREQLAASLIKALLLSLDEAPAQEAEESVVLQLSISGQAVYSGAYALAPARQAQLLAAADALAQDWPGFALTVSRE